MGPYYGPRTWVLKYGPLRFSGGISFLGGFSSNWWCSYVPLERRDPTWSFMDTYNPTYKSAYNLLRGLRGFIRAVVIGGISALNL